MTLIHAFNDKFVIAGQGTIGIEINDELQNIDSVVVPIGGGGLISGIALALKTIKPDVRVFGVEAEGAQSMKHSLEKNMIMPLKSIETIADGIAVKIPGELTFKLAKQFVDETVTVNDEEISNALYLILQRSKLVVEPAGATSLAVMHEKIYTYIGKMKHR